MSHPAAKIEMESIFAARRDGPMRHIEPYPLQHTTHTHTHTRSLTLLSLSLPSIKTHTVQDQSLLSLQLMYELNVRPINHCEFLLRSL